MQDESTFKKIFSLTEELVGRVMYEHDKMLDISPEELAKRLTTLRKLLDDLNKYAAPHLKAKGLEVAELSGMKKRPEQVDDDTWQLILKMRAIRSGATAYTKVVKKKIAELKISGDGNPSDKPLDPKEQKRAHKRRFEGPSGHKNWKPV